MKLQSSVRIMVLVCCCCGAGTFAQMSSPAGSRSGPGLDEARITAIMAAGYENLGAYLPANMMAEHKFDTNLQVRAVKSLLEGATNDVRWARILLDERILAANHENINRRTVGTIRTLQGGVKSAYPLAQPFDFMIEEADAPVQLLGTKASLETIKYLYGGPTRIEKVEKKNVDIHWYDFVGFGADTGSVRIRGLSLPYVFFKLGYRDFARLCLSTRTPAPPLEQLGGALVRTLHPVCRENGRSMVDALTYSADGQWLLAQQVGSTPRRSTFALFAANSGTRWGALDPVEPLFECGPAAISPDATLLALLSGLETDAPHLNLYRIADGALVRTVRDPAISACDFQWMPDGKALLLQEAEGSMTSPKSGARLRLLDVESGKIMWNVKTKGPAMAISPDGQYLACATGDPLGGPQHAEGYPVQIIPVQQPTNIMTFLAHKEWIACLAFSPDSTILASAGADQVVKLWSVREGELLGTRAGHEWTIHALHFTPDAKTLVSGSRDGTIRFWDVDRDAPPGMISLPNSPVLSMDLTPDGQAIAFGDEFGRVSICDFARLRELAMRR